MLDIAADKGRYSDIFHATLHVSGELIVEYGPIIQNDPSFRVDTGRVFIPSPKRIKTIKREARNFKFTHIIKWNSQGVSVTPYSKAA